MNGKRRLLGSFNHGSMANALPQAIGAQAAFPRRQVISLSGDGGFTMLMGDFISLLQLGLPVKVIIYDNGSLGFVAMEMKAGGYLDTNTDLKNPNFAAMAEAMGALGLRVERSDDLEQAPASRARPWRTCPCRRNDREAGTGPAPENPARAGQGLQPVPAESDHQRARRRSRRTRAHEPAPLRCGPPRSCAAMEWAGSAPQAAVLRSFAIDYCVAFFCDGDFRLACLTVAAFNETSVGRPPDARRVQVCRVRSRLTIGR